MLDPSAGESFDPPASRGVHVHYGCGLCAPDGWLNFDASLRLRLERVPGMRLALQRTVGLVFPPGAMPGDIVRGLPVPDGAAQGVYCSHVLEHLPRDDLPAALRNTFTMLAPGGRFRLVVPDLHWRVAQYLGSAERGDPTAADGLMEACRLGTRRNAAHPMSFMKDRVSKNVHLWMYDFAALKSFLEEAGFCDVRRCELGDCDDPMFALVEDADRLFEQGQRELAIEAVRPRAAGPS